MTTSDNWWEGRAPSYSTSLWQQAQAQAATEVLYYSAVTMGVGLHFLYFFSSKHFFFNASFKIQFNCRQKWRLNIDTIDEDQWTAAIKIVPEVSLSPSQKLTQLFILHRVYYTSQKLLSWGQSTPPNLPRCFRDTGTLVHILWRWPKLFHYCSFQTLPDLCTVQKALALKCLSWALSWMNGHFPHIKF